MGKRHFCIKIAVFKISIGSLFDIKKTYLSLAFQYLNDLCLTNLKRLHIFYKKQENVLLHLLHYILSKGDFLSAKGVCNDALFRFSMGDNWFLIALRRCFSFEMST